MADTPKSCDHIQRCELFPLITEGGVLRIWQVNYCEGAFEDCARFQCAARGERPARELLPNGALLKLSVAS